MAIDTAFALSGLGGFNAHGAGFLQAALDNAFWPELVTATSGQILVLANYLDGKLDLREGLIDENDAGDPFAQLQIALFGYPGVFRPAYGEAITRCFSPPAFTDSMIDMFADRLMPAQQYVPARSDEVIEHVVSIFNESAIGVVFNAYDPTTGKGILYGNDVARARMEKTSAIPLAPEMRMKDTRYVEGGPKETRILPITVEAVKAALWLSLYGFEGLPARQMDGAYHRSCILSELHNFPRVIVARPLANGWVGADLPRNWFDVQDWQCEMWFSVGYKAEVDAMKHINQLIRDGVITDPKFRIVDLHEITPPTPAGYFNYFVERQAVFDAAYAEADILFQQLTRQANGPPLELEPAEPALLPDAL